MVSALSAFIFLGCSFTVRSQVSSGRPGTQSMATVINGYAAVVHGSDLTIRRKGGGPVFSAKAFARSQEAALKAMNGPDNNSVQYTFRVVSITGPLLAIEETIEIGIRSQAPIPAGYARFWTIDLTQRPEYHFDNRQPLRPRQGDKTLLDLRNFYDTAALALSLQQSQVESNTVGVQNNRELKQVLSDLGHRGLDDSHCYRADADIFSSFAITKLIGNQIIVKIGLSGQSWCRYDLTEIELELPRSKLDPLGLKPPTILDRTFEVKFDGSLK